jgi:hypothetical protein
MLWVAAFRGWIVPVLDCLLLPMRDSYELSRLQLRRSRAMTWVSTLTTAMVVQHDVTYDGIGTSPTSFGIL